MIQIGFPTNATLTSLTWIHPYMLRLGFGRFSWAASLSFHLWVPGDVCRDIIYKRHMYNSKKANDYHTKFFFRGSFMLIFGSGHLIFMRGPEDYPQNKLFFLAFQRSKLFFSKLTILCMVFNKLLLRNKLFFSTKYRKETFFRQFFSPPPPPPINIKSPHPYAICFCVNQFLSNCT